MGIIDLGSHTIFRCDRRCGRLHIERYGPSWDERRFQGCGAMAPAKRRTNRKRAAKKTAGKPKRTAAKSPGRGHNNPPAEPPPKPTPPPISTWHTIDETGAQVARDTAARQRASIAATSSPPASPPFALANDPRTLHAAMLKRIAVLEETIAKLPTPGPLDDSEIEESKSTIVALKSLPPAPAKPPAETVQAQSKLKAFGQKVLESLATDAAKWALRAAALALWEQYGHQLLDLVDAIEKWIASLPK
jgi:hypothetical protein